MDLFLHSTANLIMAHCACASLIFSSINDVQFLVCADLKYLNWSTSSSTFPFIHILVDGLLGLMLLTRILLLLELISMLHQAAVFSSLSVSCCISSSLPPSRWISSANRKLQSGRRPMDTDDSEEPTPSAISELSANWPSSDCH